MATVAPLRAVVGVDLGGTNVRAAVIDKNEKIIGQKRSGSDARLGAGRVVDAVVSVIEAAITESGIPKESIVAVGMAVPGHIDTRAGIVRWSPNFGETVDGQFHMFTDVPMTEPISERIGLPVTASNDANVAALGEFRYGAGRGTRDMVMFTLGTGIGSGVISDGRLIIGSRGGAVELGHHAIMAGGAACGCGALGCLEAYCGTAPIIERAIRMIETGGDSILAAKVGRDRFALTPKQIDEAAQAGCPVALAVWEETGYYMGVGIANAMHIFNPELVVLGGGIRQATGLVESARRAIDRHATFTFRQNCKVVLAGLGGDAGVMGAAELGWRHIDGVWLS